MRKFLNAIAFVIFAWLIPGTVNAFEDGTLLFVQNGHNLVEYYTKSSYSHVAIVIDNHVYQAEPPRIRVQGLDEWFVDVAHFNEGRGSPAIVEVMVPAKKYNKKEVAAMKKFLDEQVDRRYSIRGYVRKMPGDGIHCAEMCSQAIVMSGRAEFSEPHKLSPGDLHDFVVESHKSGTMLYVKTKPEYRRGTCERWGDWWDKRWVSCKWSCRETMAFCR